PTVKPGPDWVCVNGGWLPPGHPGIPNQPVPTAQPTPPPPVNPSTCPTVKPGPDWICRNGGWLPPDYPL
ncbi:MAG: TerD family protein, partial [Bdellovibrionia bacterium]